tara:strand:+ start:105 stop:659 length:555 start_codon:yes stop_codon:yes gene_type:complete
MNTLFGPIKDEVEEFTNLLINSQRYEFSWVKEGTYQHQLTPIPPTEYSDKNSIGFIYVFGHKNELINPMTENEHGYLDVGSQHEPTNSLETRIGRQILECNGAILRNSGGTYRVSDGKPGRGYTKKCMGLTFEDQYVQFISLGHIIPWLKEMKFPLTNKKDRTKTIENYVEEEVRQILNPLIKT